MPDDNSKPLSRREFFSMLRPEVSEEKTEEESVSGLSPSRIIGELEKIGVSVTPLSENDDRLNVHCSGADEFTDKQTRLFQPLSSRIVQLDLGGTNIGDRGLRVLPHMNQLERLHLERTKVTDSGLQFVGQVDTLTYLNLFETAVSDRGLEHLTGLNQLERVFLGHTKVTDEGAGHLQDQLPEADVEAGFDLLE